MSHAPVMYTLSAPSLSALGQIQGNFNDGDLGVVGRVFYVYRSAIPALPPIGGTLAYGKGYWAPFNDVPLSETTREIIVVASGTTSAFRTPVGSYFAAHSEDVQVDISTDGGTNWIEQQYGPDYNAYYSGMWNPPYEQPMSVRDVASGIWISGGFPPAGWLVRIRWIERTAVFFPRTVSPTRFDFNGIAWIVNNAVSWTTSNELYNPNGVIVPPGPSGFVPELWRVGRHRGGLNRSTVGKDFHGSGRRLLPYFRGPQAIVADPNGLVFIGTSDIAGPSLCKLKFRVCYYSPTLRARTPFAPGLITRFAKLDRHNGNSTTVRKAQTIYVDPS